MLDESPGLEVSDPFIPVTCAQGEPVERTEHRSWTCQAPGQAVSTGPKSDCWSETVTLVAC